MVTARRSFEGRLPLAGMSRLKGLLLDPEGDCRYTLEFGRDHLGLNFVEVRAEAMLPLQCQRSLERFLHPVAVVQRLGLITDEAQEAALPEEMEALLVDESGEVHPAELIEDELILAIPVVPLDPDSKAPPADLSAEEAPEENDKPNPFAALAALKDRKK